MLISDGYVRISERVDLVEFTSLRTLDDPLGHFGARRPYAADPVFTRSCCFPSHSRIMYSRETPPGTIAIWQERVLTGHVCLSTDRCDDMWCSILDEARSTWRSNGVRASAETSGPDVGFLPPSLSDHGSFKANRPTNTRRGFKWAPASVATPRTVVNPVPTHACAGTLGALRAGGWIVSHGVIINSPTFLSS